MAPALGIDPEQLSARVEELASRLAAVERRLGQLEAASSRPATELLSPKLPAPAAPSLPARLPDFVSLLGRTLVVLGGGYLLRALSDSGSVPASFAAVAGLAYAAAWLLRADREARLATARLSATFHALTALAIAFPLVLESTLRFRIFGAAIAALTMTVTTVFGAAVARRRALGLVGAAAVGLGVGGALVLLVGTRDPLPAVFGLLAVVAAVEALSMDGPGGLRWPAALGADLALVACVAVSTRAGGSPESYAPMPALAVASAALLLALTYVASAVWRTLAKRRPLEAFELLQAPAALLIGLGGAARVLAKAGMGGQAIGAVALALGVACYLVAFAVIDRRAGQARAFYGYTTLGAALTGIGCGSLLASGPLAALLSSLGFVAVGLGVRTRRLTLVVHGTLFLLGAAATVGLLAHAWHGLLAPAVTATPDLPVSTWVLLACAAAYLALHRAALSPHAFWPRLLLAALLLWCVAGAASSDLMPLLAAGAVASPASLATVRTAVLSGLALGLAAVARRVDIAELGVLVPALLVGTGIKLLFQDFRYGSPMHLFLALGLYGGALIATTRLSRPGAKQL